MTTSLSTLESTLVAGIGPERRGEPIERYVRAGRVRAS